MLASFPITLIVATVLGFLAGLGVGGGSLLILWLTLILHVGQGQSRIMNLMFFVPAAIISCLFRWKQGKLNLKKILPAIIAACIMAGIFSYISHHMNMAILKKLFGGLLLLTGLREILYKPIKKIHS